MKKLLLLTLAVFVTGFVFSQSLSLSNEDGPIADHGTVLILGDPADEEIVAHIYVTNNAAESKDVMVFRRQNYMASDSSWSQFCWGACFPGTLDTCMFPIAIAAGTTDELSFSGHYHPKMAPGSASVTYVFYDANNMSDSVAVNVEYKASPTGMNETLANSISVSEVYPNPANNVAFIDLNIPEGLNNAQLIVSNLLGSEVKSLNINERSGKVRIDVGDLKNGLYFCTIKAQGQLLESKRLVVNH